MFKLKVDRELETVELKPKVLAAFGCREFVQVVSYVP